MTGPIGGARPAGRFQRLVRGGSPIEAPWLLDAALLGSYVAVRLFDQRVALAIWLAIALAAALRWPASGLGLAAAIVVFPQPVRFGLTATVPLIVAAGMGLLFDHLARRRTVTLPSPWAGVVIVGTVALIGATFLALTHSAHRFAPEVVVAATLRWSDLVSGLVGLLLAIRVAALGSGRPFLLMVVGVTGGLAVALADVAVPAVLHTPGLGALLSGSSSGRGTGPFASPNRLGTVAGVMAIVALAHLVARDATRRARDLLAAGGLLILALSALIVSYSRGAILGVLVAGGLATVARSRRLAVAYLALAVVVAVLVGPLLISARLAAAGGTFDELAGNDASRVDAWLAGIRMILDEPIFGQGYHSFLVLGARFGATDGLTTAHNELIDFWAASGFAAAAGYLAIVVGTLGATLTRLRTPNALAAAGAVVVFFAASSFNVQSPFLAVTIPLWVVIAGAWLRGGSSPPPRLRANPTHEEPSLASATPPPSLP